MMSKNLVQYIKTKDLRTFVEETEALLSESAQRAYEQYERYLLATGALVNESCVCDKCGCDKCKCPVEEDAGLEGEALLEARMTRQHFRQVADALKNVEDVKKREELAHHHAEIFQKSNRNFDKARFFAACDLDAKLP
jgi:hypothetical protein